MIVSSEEVADIDLRVDDHAAPLVELHRLLGVFARDAAPFRTVVPTVARPSGVFDLHEIEALYAGRGRPFKFDG